ncbi:MAG: alkaline phosphatase family protein, partial [Candidatus Neomarinimicrobiota bacterium]
MNKIIKGLIIIAALNLITCTLPFSKPPRLIILLVVDQMRPDLLTRFDDLYRGGFRWLMDNGIWFTDAHHEHSYTATGPGHTAIGFGQYPGKVGVIGNSFYDRNLKKNVNCVEDPKAKIIGSNRGIARSSVRIDANGLGDWIK